MSTDAVLNIFSSLGFPMATLIFLGFVLYKYLPKFIKVYGESIDKQQAAFANSQTKYNEQSDKIIKIGMESALGLEHVSQALNQNSEVNLKMITQHSEINENILKALVALETNMTNFSDKLSNHDSRLELHDQRVEHLYSDVARILAIVQASIGE